MKAENRQIPQKLAARLVCLLYNVQGRMNMRCQIDAVQLCLKKGIYIN